MPRVFPPNVHICAVFFCLVLFFCSPSLYATQPICASVKIEIRQEVTLERQAFEAHMRINNGVAGIDLQNVKVQLLFFDENGEEVAFTTDPHSHNNTTYKFFARYAAEDALGFTGNPAQGGLVKGASSADLYWLIIPIPGAGSPRGTLYKVGARLTYSAGGSGDVQEVVVTPDIIRVKPMPELFLEYFLHREVWAGEPFELGLRVRNTGQGTAHRLTVESSQPSIVDNKQHLLINFSMTGSSVNGAPVQPGLKVSMGDIPAGGAAVAAWTMLCSRNGTFEENMAADISHADELGGSVTSLIRDVTTHMLFRQVQIDSPGRDRIPDFLSEENHSWIVYGSDGQDEPVTLLAGATSSPLPGHEGTVHAVSVAAQSNGHGLIRLRDPLGGHLHLVQVVRADGRVLPERNAWIGRTSAGQPELCIFDTDTVQSYTAIYDGSSANAHAPELSLNGTTVSAAGKQLSITVTAADADGDTLRCSITSVPAGATTNIQHQNGTMTLSWTPGLHQTGNHTVVFSATDGMHTTALPVTLTVDGAEDRDGDGLPDLWELSTFGALDRDGSGDFDNDGISDAEEYVLGTDPRVFDPGPHAPDITFPPDGARLGTLTPEFRLQLIRAEGPCMVDAQILTADSLESVAFATLTPKDGAVSWTAPAPLEEDRSYVFRARLRRAGVGSGWSMVRFRTSSVNAPPIVPLLESPLEGELVPLRPWLRLGPVRDPEGDPVLARFVISADQTRILVSSGNMTADQGAAWQSPVLLEDNGTYWWRAEIHDIHGQEQTTAWTAFTARTDARQPAEPEVSAPETVNAANASLEVRSLPGLTLHAQALLMDSGRLILDASIPADIRGRGRFILSGLPERGLLSWRVRAENGTASSWASGVMDVRQKPPVAPLPHDPQLGATTGLFRPWLSILAPEGEILHYEFEVYANSTLIASGNSTSPRWLTTTDLPHRVPLTWRARAADSMGPGPFCDYQEFLVNAPGVDAPPTFQWEDDSTPPGAGPFTLAWDNLDADSNITISLFSCPKPDGENATEILAATSFSDGRNKWIWTGPKPGLHYIGAHVTDGVSAVRSIRPVPVLAGEEKPGPGRPRALDDNRVWRASETVVTGNVIQGEPDGGQADMAGTGTIRISGLFYRGKKYAAGETVRLESGSFVLAADGSYTYTPQPEESVLYDADTTVSQSGVNVQAKSFTRPFADRLPSAVQSVSKSSQGLGVKESFTDSRAVDHKFVPRIKNWKPFMEPRGQGLVFDLEHPGRRLQLYTASASGLLRTQTDQFVLDFYDEQGSYMHTEDNAGAFHHVPDHKTRGLAISMPERARYLGVRAVPTDEEQATTASPVSFWKIGLRSSSFYVTRLAARRNAVREEIVYTIADEAENTDNATLRLIPAEP